MNVDNREIKEDSQIAEALNTYFVSTLTSENESNIPNLPQIIENRTLLISEKRMEEILSGINQEKSEGPDGIHPAILKQISRKIARNVTIIFRRSLETGEIPKDWKRTNVTPIHKKKIKTNQAITVLSV